MQDLRYPEVHSSLLVALPEIREEYKKKAWLVEGEGDPRQYLVIELVLNPVLRELLDTNRDRTLLGRIFEFLERMATSSDPEVVNLLGVGVFERMVNEPTRISVAWRHMGVESRKLARRVARGLLREQNLPPE